MLIGDKPILRPCHSRMLRLRAVVCQFGLMFVPDKQAAFREARRVLRKGGVFAFNVWDSMAANPYTHLIQETLAKLFPADPPQFFTIPFSFHDREVLRQLLTTHDFGNVHLETVTLEARSESAKDLATGFIQGSPLSTAIQERGASFESHHCGSGGSLSATWWCSAVSLDSASGCCDGTSRRGLMVGSST